MGGWVLYNPVLPRLFNHSFLPPTHPLSTYTHTRRKCFLPQTKRKKKKKKKKKKEEEEEEEEGEKEKRRGVSMTGPPASTWNGASPNTTSLKETQE